MTKKTEEEQRDFAAERERAEALYNQKIKNDYNRLRGRLHALSPEDRAKDKVVVEFIKTVIMATGNTPTREIVAELLPHVIKFYRENQNNIYPNPLCFKDYLPKGNTTGFTFGGMRIIENIIGQDYRQASIESR
jgi:citrate synthase